MNIFILDQDFQTSCRYHVNAHVVKMPLEQAQLLSTALRVVNGNDWVNEHYPMAYKATHVNHPCAVWVRESLDNWLWLQECTMWLGEEFKYRYGKEHKSVGVVECLTEPPDLPSKGLTPFAQAMPTKYKRNDPVEAYRAYYVYEKIHLAYWKNRTMPEWYRNLNSND